MEALELLEIIASGETTKVQLKSDVNNVISIAQEMVAFTNTKGGLILIGVDDKTGNILELTFQDIQRINNLLATAAHDHVKSPIIISTETVTVNEKRVIVVTVPEGTDKPHTDKDGVVWVKNGSDKRKVISKEELSRLLQSSGNLYAEERLIQHSSLDDFDWEKFKKFYEEKYKEPADKEEISKYLSNLRIGENNKLNVAGALLFGKNLQKLTPAFFINAIWFWGNDIAETEYRSSENIIGTLDILYHRGFDFVLSKLQKVQSGQSFNSLGKSEIPEIVITELLVNALIHRDYFINDSIKLFVFENRIEIISPGKLPNSLTEEQIKKGVRRSRNNIIASLAPDLLEYRGAGSGIVRAISIYPDITLINEQEKERFIAIIKRPEVKTEPQITMSSSSNIERQLIALKTGIPHDIFVKGGFDYYDTIFHIRYPKTAFGKRISLALKDATGQSVSQTIELKDGGEVSFQFSGDIESSNLNRNFGFLQLVAQEDLNIEIWSEVMEGGFL